MYKQKYYKYKTKYMKMLLKNNMQTHNLKLQAGGRVDPLILERLRANDPLFHRVDLRNDPINDQDIKLIMRALSNNTNVFELDLSNNRITDIGVYSIVNGLELSSTVRKSNIDGLNLSNNLITDKGIRYIIDAGSNHFRYLNLANNQITNEAAHYIINQFRISKPRIEYLILTNNHISPDLLRRIDHLLSPRMRDIEIQTIFYEKERALSSQASSKASSSQPSSSQPSSSQPSSSKASSQPSSSQASSSKASSSIEHPSMKEERLRQNEAIETWQKIQERLLEQEQDRLFEQERALSSKASSPQPSPSQPSPPQASSSQASSSKASSSSIEHPSMKEERLRQNEAVGTWQRMQERFLEQEQERLLEQEHEEQYN
ncbi:MAG: hypothetical protein Homavirus16_2 [Homavirus sp.]|uniref:Leucine Rich Repeat family protein n=1 Tax=Homavirus sp. TaxID=2487769 RepID=A0A3G5A8P1_9VIRU|nr:MAG: hypothetical protein Homavirus16_2 [Homavirus sp.]